MEATERFALPVLGSPVQRLGDSVAASHQSVCDFTLHAAEAGANEVLTSRTVVPAETFDLMVAEPTTPEHRMTWIRDTLRNQQFKQV